MTTIDAGERAQPAIELHMRDGGARLRDALRDAHRHRFARAVRDTLRDHGLSESQASRMAERIAARCFERDARDGSSS